MHIINKITQLDLDGSQGRPFFQDRVRFFSDGFSPLEFYTGLKNLIFRVSRVIF